MGKKRSTTRRTRRRGARATTRRDVTRHPGSHRGMSSSGVVHHPRGSHPREERVHPARPTARPRNGRAARRSFPSRAEKKSVSEVPTDESNQSLDASPRRTPCARRRGRWRVVLSRPPRRSSSERSRAPSSRGGGRGRVVARTATTATTASASASRWRATKNGASSGAFYTLVPIRPRPRGERRSLRTFPGASLRPGSLGFNPRPRRLSTPPDAFELHPDKRPSGGSAWGS